MGARLRSFDWSVTSLGPIAGWPPVLRIAVDQTMSSLFPSCLFWGPDLVMLYNDGYVPILGQKPDALGQPLRLVWSEVWDDLRPIAQRALAGESTYVDEYRLEVLRHGQPEEAFFTFCYSPVFDAEGRVAGVLDTVIETTERRRAETRLLAAQQRLRAANEAKLAERTAERDVLARIVETTTAQVQVVDMDHRFLAMNPACAAAYEAVFGFRPAIGEDVFAVMDRMPVAEDRDFAIALWRRALSGESFRLQQAWGEGPERRWFDMNFEVLRGPDGVQTGAFLIGSEITDQRRAQAALVEAQDALRQAQKMEAVGQLTGGLAHDFNNLLASISSALQVMKVKLARQQPEGLGRYIEIGENSVRRAASLTHRLLAFSRRQTLDPRPTDVNRLVFSIEDLIDRTVGPGVEFRFDPGAELWATRVDASQLENSLLNLCINARDAMTPQGGALAIHTANVHLAGRAAAEARVAEGDYVRISVADTGTGIAPADMARIFEPFFTTKPIGQGTGLGLSMVYGFVQQSEGQVQVVSEPGRGTTMHLYLPRYAGPVDGAPAVSAGAPLAQGDGETVLLVEDEDALRDLMREVLTEAGYRVLTAADGPEGLRCLQTPGRIDLMVSDVGLPGGLNGRQVADSGRLLRPGLKVLFVTGYAQKGAVDHGLAAGGMEVMSKPFEIGALAERVQAMLAAPG